MLELALILVAFFPVIIPLTNGSATGTFMTFVVWALAAWLYFVFPPAAAIVWVVSIFVGYAFAKKARDETHRRADQAKLS